MKKIFWTTVALALSAPSAFAVNLTFQFAINSSGPDLYACNAGIRHSASTQVCWETTTGNSCVPTTTNASTCICTGEADGTNGTWNKDILLVKSGDWVDATTVGSITDTEIKASNSSSTFNSIFADDATAFSKHITELTVDLGSEVYGSEYFVDICYRGTQVAQSNNGNAYGLKGNVTVTNLRSSEASAPNYQVISDLKGKAEIKCFISKNQSSTNDTIPGTLSYNYTANSGGSYTSMASSASVVSLLSDSNMTSTGGDKTPRLCIARYYFKENSTELRKWKMQQAKGAIFTEISDKSGI